MHAQGREKGCDYSLGKKHQRDTLDLFRGRRADNSPAALELSLSGSRSFDMKGPPVKRTDDQLAGLNVLVTNPSKHSIILEAQIVWRSLRQIKPEIPGDFWWVKRPQVAPVLQEHGVAACPQQEKDPPGAAGSPKPFICHAKEHAKPWRSSQISPKLSPEDGELEIQSLQQVVR